MEFVCCCFSNVELRAGIVSWWKRYLTLINMVQSSAWNTFVVVSAMSIWTKNFCWEQSFFYHISAHCVPCSWIRKPWKWMKDCFWVSCDVSLNRWDSKWRNEGARILFQCRYFIFFFNSADCLLLGWFWVRVVTSLQTYEIPIAEQKKRGACIVHYI